MELHLKKGKFLYRTPSSNTESGIFGNFYSTKEVAKKSSNSNRMLIFFTKQVVNYDLIIEINKPI